jgi:threonine synthase
VKYQLKCWKCGAIAEKEPAYKCPRCGNILEAKYNIGPGDYIIHNDRPGIFKFDCVLPSEGNYDISLGEGNTPLIQSVNNGKSLGLERLYFKLECSNPTGSFKDRAFAVIMRCARNFGTKKLIIASTGNASAAAAAYAARCNMDLVAVIPEATPKNKVLQAMTYGATVVKVPGVYSDSYRLCREMSEKYGWFDLTTTYINPYAREGYKTLGYEIFEQIKSVPDWIVFPVGDGPILASVHQAFCELKAMGVVDRVPKLACVQSENCGPIAEAFVNSRNKVAACVNPKPTLASGINDSLFGYDDDGDFTLASIRESGGTALLLTEKEITESVCMLAKDGVYAEPAGAVGMIGAEKLLGQGIIRKDETVVVVVTGHGLKNPLKIEVADPPVVSSANELAEFLKNTDRR